MAPEIILFYFFQILFLERGEGGRKRGRQTSLYKRHINCLPLARPCLGTWLAAQACVLTGNRTSDLLVYKLMLNPLGHTSQGWNCLRNAGLIT